MKHLTSDKIAQLNSDNVYLSSGFANGKLLTINSDKKVVLESQKTTPNGQTWKLLPVKDGEFLISSKNNDLICHHMKDEGEINIQTLPKDYVKNILKENPSENLSEKTPKDKGHLQKPEDKDHLQKPFEDKGHLQKVFEDGCIWKLGKTGEIYQSNPSGGEKYLWLADNELFVTLDGFLAESWIPFSEKELPPKNKEHFSKREYPSPLPSNSNRNKYIFVSCSLVIIVFFTIIILWRLFRRR